MSAIRDHFDPSLIKRLGRLDLSAQLLAKGMQEGTHRSLKTGFSTEFSDYKPYLPGDDIRYIDWRLYARTGRLYIKRFEADTNLEILFLLDTSRSMNWRHEQQVNKHEYASVLIATLASLAVSKRDQAGLLMHDESGLTALPPRSRRMQLEEIFACLEQVQPGTESHLRDLCRQSHEVKKHRGQVYVFSDLEEDEDEIAEALEDLAGADDEVTLFHLLDHAEVELPFSPKCTHLLDSETGRRIPIKFSELKKAHEDGLRDFRQSRKSICQDLDIHYVPIHTGMNYLDLLYEFIAERARKA